MLRAVVTMSGEERKPMGATTFVVAFSIPILLVLGIAIWQLSWWPVLIFFGIVFGSGFSGGY